MSPEEYTALSERLDKLEEIAAHINEQVGLPRAEGGAGVRFDVTPRRYVRLSEAGGLDRVSSTAASRRAPASVGALSCSCPPGAYSDVGVRFAVALTE